MFYFFFQAEDGIRDYEVTGVQTCALPICLVAPVKAPDSDVQTLHVVDRVSPDEWSLTVLDPVRFVPLRAGVAR